MIDPVTGIAIAAPIVTGIMGANAADRANEEAARLRAAALAEYDAINIPTLAEQELNLILPEYLGGYTGQTESIENLGPSAMEGLSVDPRLKDAQMAALEQLSEIGSSGMTPAEAAALRQARRQVAGEAQAKQNQILQEMQRRGVAGSGMELAARLNASEASADRLGQESDRQIQIAQERALQAISQGAGLAGNIRSQDTGEQEAIARAKDAINQFNVSNRQNVGARNVASANQIGQRNQAEAQRIAEARGNVQNQQQQYNKELLQTQYKNRMDKAGLKAGYLNNEAAIKTGQGANEGNFIGQIGKNIGEGIKAYQNYQNQNDFSGLLDE